SASASARCRSRSPWRRTARMAGILLPTQGAPGWFSVASEKNPLTYVVEAVRALFAGDYPVDTVLSGFAGAGIVAVLGVVVGVGRRDHDPAGGLGEERHELVTLETHRAADAVGQRGLDQRLREAAVGDVVGAGEQAHSLDQQLRQGLLAGQVDLGRGAAEVA